MIRNQFRLIKRGVSIYLQINLKGLDHSSQCAGDINLFPDSSRSVEIDGVNSEFSGITRACRVERHCLTCTRIMTMKP